MIGWLISLMWSVTPERPRRLVHRGFPPELAPEVFGPPTPPHLELIHWRTVVVGVSLSILMVAILFGIVSRGDFPLSLAPAGRPQHVVAVETIPSPTAAKTMSLPPGIQASN